MKHLIKAHILAVNPKSHLAMHAYNNHPLTANHVRVYWQEVMLLTLPGIQKRHELTDAQMTALTKEAIHFISPWKYL